MKNAAKIAMLNRNDNKGRHDYRHSAYEDMPRYDNDRRMYPNESRRRGGYMDSYNGYDHRDRDRYDRSMDRERYHDDRYRMNDRRYEDDDHYFFKVKGKFGREELNEPYIPEMDMKTAEGWTKSMVNADGSKGAHWNQEQIKQLLEQKADLQGYDLPEVFSAMNMLYSDYCEVAKKFGVNNIDFYVCLAKAWLDDEDANEHKTMRYYDCVVKK